MPRLIVVILRVISCCSVHAEDPGGNPARRNNRANQDGDKGNLEG